MQLIKVLATDSTNDFLRAKYRENPAISNSCLWAKHQRKGKGQRGSSWQTEAGKNLTFSLLINNLQQPVRQNFKISMLVSLGLVEKLEEFAIPQLSLKWPNDILSGKQKIGGILIENILSGQSIKASIIGIGLNVNQNNFPGQKKAGSLRQKTGHTFSLEELLSDLIDHLENRIFKGMQQDLLQVKKQYYAWLFRLNKKSVFEFPDNVRKEGIIKGVADSGQLIVIFDTGRQEFDIKAIKLIY